MAEYGHRHRQVRRFWAPVVAGGGVDCARCGERIAPGTPWDLGHDDTGERLYSGPEHRACNRRAGQAKRWNGWRPYEAGLSLPAAAEAGTKLEPKPKRVTNW